MTNDNHQKRFHKSKRVAIATSPLQPKPTSLALLAVLVQAVGCRRL